MKLSDYLARIKRIDALIQQENTGSPADLAETLALSESMVYNYLNFMKQAGAPIEYSKRRKTYFYQECGGFNFEFHRQGKQL